MSAQLQGPFSGSPSGAPPPELQPNAARPAPAMPQETLTMKPLAGALAALTLSACAQASDCGFAPLKLVASPEAPTTFVGDGQHLQVRFVNENPDIAEPDSFPEPPVVVLDKASGKSCNIEDGGIWA
eukprot:gene53369-65186_t